MVYLRYVGLVHVVKQYLLFVSVCGRRGNRTHRLCFVCQYDGTSGKPSGNRYTANALTCALLLVTTSLSWSQIMETQHRTRGIVNARHVDDVITTLRRVWNTWY